LAALLLLVLTGCRVDVGVTVTLDEQGGGSVEVRALGDADLLNREPSLLGDLRLQDIRAAGWTVEGPTVQTDGSALLVLTKGFADVAEGNAVLAEISSPTGPWRDLQLSHALRFATIESGLDGHMVAVGPEAFSDAGLNTLVGKVPLADLGDPIADGTLVLTMTSQMPGEPVRVGGGGITNADQGTVTWTITKGTDTAFFVDYERRDAGAVAARRTAGLARAAIVLYLAAVVVMGILLLLWWLHQRRHPEPDRPDATARPPVPPARG